MLLKGINRFSFGPWILSKKDSRVLPVGVPFLLITLRGLILDYGRFFYADACRAHYKDCTTTCSWPSWGSDLCLACSYCIPV